MPIYLFLFLILFSSCRGTQTHRSQNQSQDEGTTLEVEDPEFTSSSESESGSQSSNNPSGSETYISEKKDPYIPELGNPNSSTSLGKRIEDIHKALTVDDALTFFDKSISTDEDITKTLQREFTPGDESNTCKKTPRIYPCRFGSGGMGISWLAQVEGVEYIVKVFKKNGKGSEWSVAREIAPFVVMGKHENIVNFIGAFKSGEEKSWKLVLEKGEGDLNMMFRNKSLLTKENIKKAYLGIVNGLRHMESAGLAHGDLKTGNVVYFLDGNQLTTKLIDFGSATALKYHEGAGTGLTYTRSYSIVSEVLIGYHLRNFVSYSEVKAREDLSLTKWLEMEQKIEKKFKEKKIEYKDNPGLLIRKLAKYVKDSYPGIIQNPSKAFQHSWEKQSEEDQLWKEAVIRYLKRYKRTMSDVFSLGVMLNKIKTRAPSQAYPFKSGAIEKLTKTNPFERPKLDEIWGIIY